MTPAQQTLWPNVAEVLGLCDDVSKGADATAMLAKLEAARQVNGSRMEYGADVDYRLERVMQETVAFRLLTQEPGREKSYYKALKTLRRALRLLATELEMRRA
jgi:hypothetical protein